MQNSRRYGCKTDAVPQAANHVSTHWGSGGMVLRVAASCGTLQVSRKGVCKDWQHLWGLLCFSSQRNSRFSHQKSTPLRCSQNVQIDPVISLSLLMTKPFSRQASWISQTGSDLVFANNGALGDSQHLCTSEARGLGQHAVSDVGSDTAVFLE